MAKAEESEPLDPPLG